MSTHCGFRASRQRGQALPLIVVFMLVLCVGLLLTFNTGQVVNKKVEVTNAADAAAYSVAVEQARAWNLAAYLNRGRVANEVAIAQLVSLNSWLTQINVSAFNFEMVCDVLSLVPIIGPAFAGAAQVFNAADRALRPIRSGLRGTSKVAIGVMDGLNAAYATTAYAVIEAASAASAVQTARTVAADNSPRAGLRAAALGLLTKQMYDARVDYLDEFSVPSGRNRTSTGGERYRNLVMESRDAFTRNRKDDWLVLVANGGTDLVDYDRWAAVDVNEVNFSYFFDTFRIPVGWAGAQALGSNQQPPFFPGIKNGAGWRSDYSGRRYRPYNGVSRRGISGRLVEGDPGGSEVGGQKSYAYFTTYRYGLAHRFHDVKRGKAVTPDSRSHETGDSESGPVFTVEVGTALDSARTTRVLGIGTGRMTLPEQAKGNQIRAVASAQVYFNRPHEYGPFRRVVWGRSDGKFESGSMFSPYWQARLVDTPRSARALLLAAP